MVDLSKAKLGFATPRHHDVDLAYPVTVDGAEYGAVRVRRLTAREVGDFIEQARAVDVATARKEDLPTLRFFSLVGKGGEVITDLSVEDLALALDDDDLQEVNLKSLDFLPRRLLLGSEPDPEIGKGTSPSSPASSTPPSENSSEPTGSTSSGTSTTP